MLEIQSWVQDLIGAVWVGLRQALAWELEARGLSWSSAGSQLEFSWSSAGHYPEGWRLGKEAGEVGQAGEARGAGEAGEAGEVGGW